MDEEESPLPRREFGCAEWKKREILETWKGM